MKNVKSKLVLATAVLSLVIVVMWVLSVRKSSEAVALIGAGYAFLCFAFLIAQIVAFVKAHVDYDQTVEQPKFDLMRLEDNP
ncbi:MAG TPA: hypothetical protein VFX30_12005 [bacterium]|nr:hypothetical protein [bacterium]